MQIHVIKYISPTRGLCYDTETAPNSIACIKQFMERRPNVRYFSYRAPRSQWFDVTRTETGYECKAR